LGAGACKLGLVSVEQRELRRGGDRIAAFSCLREGGLERMDPGSSLTCTGRGCAAAAAVEMALDIGRKIFTVAMAKHWKRLPRTAVEYVLGKTRNLAR